MTFTLENIQVIMMIPGRQQDTDAISGKQDSWAETGKHPRKVRSVGPQVCDPEAFSGHTPCTGSMYVSNVQGVKKSSKGAPGGLCRCSVCLQLRS